MYGRSYLIVRFGGRRLVLTSPIRKGEDRVAHFGMFVETGRLTSRELRRLKQIMNQHAAQHHQSATVASSTTPLSAEARKADAPPLAAERLLYFILPKSQREALPGDLAEEYSNKYVPKFGRRYADAWYWKEVTIAVTAAVGRQIGKFLSLAWLVRALLNRFSL